MTLMSAMNGLNVSEIERLHALLLPDSPTPFTCKRSTSNQHLLNLFAYQCTENTCKLDIEVELFELTHLVVNISQTLEICCQQNAIVLEKSDLKEME